MDDRTHILNPRDYVHYYVIIIIKINWYYFVFLMMKLKKHIES